MLAVVVSIIVGLGGAFALWQAWLRWRAYGTADVRELVAEARITFYDITAHGELDTSEFLTGDRQTLEQRLRDVRGASSTTTSCRTGSTTCRIASAARGPARHRSGSE